MHRYSWKAKKKKKEENLKYLKCNTTYQDQAYLSFVGMLFLITVQSNIVWLSENQNKHNHLAIKEYKNLNYIK